MCGYGHQRDLRQLILDSTPPAMSVPNPLVRDRDIRAAVKDKGHWLNPDAQRRTVCISDIGRSYLMKLLKVAGLGNDLAVHFTSLGPNKESTV